MGIKENESKSASHLGQNKFVFSSDCAYFDSTTDNSGCTNSDSMSMISYISDSDISRKEVIGNRIFLPPKPDLVVVW